MWVPWRGRTTDLWPVQRWVHQTWSPSGGQRGSSGASPRHRLGWLERRPHHWLENCIDRNDEDSIHIQGVTHQARRSHGASPLLTTSCQENQWSEAIGETSATHTKNEGNAWNKNYPGSTDMDRSSYRQPTFICPTKALLKMLLLFPHCDM